MDAVDDLSNNDLLSRGDLLAFSYVLVGVVSHDGDTTTVS